MSSFRGMRLTAHIPPVIEVINVRSYTSTPDTSSWCVEYFSMWNLHLYDVSDAVVTVQRLWYRRVGSVQNYNFVCCFVWV